MHGRVLLASVLLALGACSRKPVVFSSPTGGYSVRLPATHGEVKTRTYAAPGAEPLLVTEHRAALGTTDYVFMTEHVDLPEVTIQPGEERRFLRMIVNAWVAKLRGNVEEIRDVTFDGRPALECVTTLQIPVGLFPEAAFQNSPFNRRSRILLIQNRLIALHFGVIERWKLDHAAGKDFFDSFVYGGPKSP